MSVDFNLHTNTQYRIPDLEKQIEEQIDRVGSFVIDCNEDNWDGYGADPVSVDTLKFTAEVLKTIQEWFVKNIGFLNNRSINFFTAPFNSGEVRIEIEYADLFEINFFVKYKEKVNCLFWPLPRFILDGTKTIADREFPMLLAKINLKKKLA